jgi:hypothetical protein
MDMVDTSIIFFDQQVLSKLITTPKALANFSPELELATTLGLQLEIRANAESVRQ